MASANNFQFVDWLSAEPLRLLLNMMEVSRGFNTGYSKEFEQDFAIGDSARIKLPQQYLIRTGLGYNPQPLNRIYTTVTCDQVFGIDFEYDSVQKALEMERPEAEISKEYLQPAVAQIKQELDSRCAQFAYQHANNIVGTLGTDPTSLSVFNQARQRLIEKAGWQNQDNKVCCIAPAINTALVPTALGLFNPPDAISKQYREGAIGRYAGVDWYESMSLYSHTAGTWQTPASVTVSGSNQSGTSLLVNCTSGDTFKKGDVIGLGAGGAGTIYPTNPMTRRQTNASNPMTVVVQADVTASASTATLTISPAIFGPGSQYQNVTALPGDTLLLVLFPGTTSPNGKTGTQSLIFGDGAYAIVGVKLETPKAVEMSSNTRDPKTGIAMRFTRTWDPQLSKFANRFDVLMGFGPLRPDNCAVRVLGA